jgi:release factor glutamine methyltransferase
MTILAARQWGGAQLASQTEVSSLEVDILLADLLQVNRSSLHAWPERELTAEQQHHFQQRIHRRCLGEPIAYIVGHREFWSLDFIVTPDTLIPRMETELLVERVLALFQDLPARTIADLGTGSGAIALSIAKERPHWTVHATDCMSAALQVARLNAERFGISNAILHEGDWCQALPVLHFDAIISNPPYIGPGDPDLSQAVAQYEPHSALLSGLDGLEDIQKIIQQARSFLCEGGYLLLEHGYQQARAVRRLMEDAGYSNIVLYQDLAGLDRVTMGQFY